MTLKIELQNVSFSYDGAAPIARDISFIANPGEALAIITPVGGGKSTLLKICAGLIEPEQGELIIDKKYFWQLSAVEQNHMRRRMGFDFQECALIANMSVFDNLALPLRYHGGAGETQIKNQIEGWLECFELMPYRKNLPAALSIGLRRRVSFIRAMLLGQEFLFFDEPTQDADPKFIKIVTDTIRSKKGEGSGVIFTTQNGEFLKTCADRAVVIKDGKVMFSGHLKNGTIPVDISGEAMLRE